MYPCGADLAGTKILWCTYGNVQFDEHIIRNGLELFVDADHAHDVTDLYSIYYILFTFLGITVYWKVGKKTFITTHSTDSEVCTLYIVTKMEEYLRHILEYIGVEFYETTCGLEDTQPTIDIIQAN